MSGEYVLIRSAAYVRMPWRNGRGFTNVIVESPELRLSVAEIAAAGPFSSFPGVSRTIVPLDGPLILETPNERVELEVLQPHAFSGEAAVCCAMPSGPVVAFNAMAPRDVAHRVQVCMLSGGESCRADALYVVRGSVRCAGGEEALAGDTVLGGYVSCAAPAVVVAVCT